jgi:ATP-dependent protease ClpP protease subunit
MQLAYLCQRSCPDIKTAVLFLCKQITKSDDNDYKKLVQVVMQLVYLCQRSCLDIKTAISFLCTQMTKSDDNNYKKLVQVVKYVRATKDMKLTLSVSGNTEINWSVDASYAVHNDMKGHTGGSMTLGTGLAFSMSWKQKLVALSSTESELIEVHDVMPQIIWTNNFLHVQGLQVS